MRSLLCVLLLEALAIAAPAGVSTSFAAGAMTTVPLERCAVGAKTSLWLGGEYPMMPMHDGPEGEATFEVHAGDKASDKVVGKQTLPGRGRCLGYAPALHAYVIASLHEVGSIVPLASLALVGDDGALRDTAFDKSNYFAYALAVSADARYIAFIGERDDFRLRLYLLDLSRDRVRVLGDAPAPPPAPTSAARGRWHWGVDGEEGYVDIEPDVLRIDGAMVRASYGKDTRRARNKTRRVRTWPIAELDTSK